MKILNLWMAFHFFIYGCGAWASSYVVQAGDSVSQITYKLVGSPVYGPGRNLEKIIKINSWIKNSNSIFPGQVVDLGDLDLLYSDSLKRDTAGSRENTALAGAEDISPIVQTSSDKYVQDRFSVSPDFFFTRIDATDLSTRTGAILLSSLAYGITFSWLQEWSDKIKIFEDLGMKHISFIDNTTGSDSIVNPSLNLYNFGLGAEYSFSDDVALGGKLMYNQEVYSHGLTTTTGVALDVVAVPSGQAWTKIKLVERSPFVLSTELGAKLLMPAATTGYETKSGAGVFVKLIIEKKTGKYNFSYDLYYLHQEQNSAIADYTRRDVGVNLTINWK